MTEREKDLSLSEFFRMLRHRRILIFGCAIILGVFLTLVALASDPTYEAKASIQIAGQSGGLGVLSEYFSIGTGSQVTNEVEIIRSRSIAEAVIESQGLRLDIRDSTYGNPVIKAIMFVFSDRLVRGLRSLRVEDVEFPSSSIDKTFILEFTDDSGNFNVTGPAGNMGSGQISVPFSSDTLAFTVAGMKGTKGTRFSLTPRSLHRTLLGYRSRMMASPVGGAARTNLIQVSYKDSDPGLASSIANAILNEYERRNTEWKSSMGQAQTTPIEAQLSQVYSDLQEADIELENYKNQYGVVVLPEEAKQAVSILAQREAEKIDVNLRLSMLQGIHSQLASELDSDTFSVPPSLTGDLLIQQLSVDHARLTVELNDLLLDYTENHPSVISKSEAITGVRENILDAISATTRSLIEQRYDLDGVISEYELRLYSIPGLERNLIELTRKRDVAEEAYRLLLGRLSEAKLVTSSFMVGNRIIDEAAPPSQPVAPSIKRNLGMGLGLGFILGIFLAFLIEITDPRLRRPDQLTGLLNGSPLTSIRAESDEEISRAASVLALSILRCEQPSIALVCPGADSSDFRAILESVIFELSRGVHPILLVDPVATADKNSFFGVESSPGLAEIGRGKSVDPRVVENGRVLVLPAGSDPSSTYATNPQVRERIKKLQENAGLTCFYLPDFANDPALRGWTTLAGGVVLVLRRNQELQSDILGVFGALESDKVPILAALLID